MAGEDTNAPTVSHCWHLLPRGGSHVSRARAERRRGAAAGGAGHDPIKMMVERLDLEKYKATIKGLTQFGDRRQGTERNREAVDWIEAQLKSYGCTNTERIKYDYQPHRPRGRGDAGAARRAATGAARTRRSQAARPRGAADDAGAPAAAGARAASATRTGVNTDPLAQPDREAPRAERAADDAGAARGGLSARRSAPRTPTRCTSSAATWTGTAGARPRTTTARARRS